jgi:uracil-DNA glycosylase
MALDDMLVEELGIGPIWVRRGVKTGVAACVPGGQQETPAVAPDEGLRQEAMTARATRADPPPEDAVANADANEAPARPDEIRTAVERALTPPASSDVARQAPEAPPAAASADLEPPFFDPAEALPWTDDDPAPRSPVAADTVQDDVHTLDWPALEARVSECQRCRLCERRTNTVFGVGDREADWMLIGEAPGENEDKQGEPFVGQAGKLLDNMLRALTLSRESNVYIANVIKCRPPGNRNPELDEVARCEPYLQRQVELVKPKVIVALGRFAAQSLLKSEGSIASMRGRIHEYQGVPVVVTYHPAYLLRSLPDKAKAWADLCLARGAYRDALAKLGVEPSADTAKQGAR